VTARDVLDGIRVRAKAYTEHGTPGLAAPRDRAHLIAAIDAVLDVGKYDFPINSHTEGYNEALDDVRAAIENALKESQ
jgi:hypothetical protein